MFYRKYLTCVASLSLSAGLWIHSSSSLHAQSSIDLNEAERMLDLNVVELETQLVKGLRLFTNEQKNYVHQVVLAVKNRQIPRSMVNVVYVWSIERNPKYPFLYFQPALRAIGKQRGLTVP